MTELTTGLIETLIDCKDDDVPPARIIQLMASEISRIRSYGDMVPAPEEELVQRCVTLNAKLNSNPEAMETIERLSALLHRNLGINLKDTLMDTLSYIVGDTPTNEEGGGWIEVTVELLRETERVVHDAVGFGSSHDVKTHNSSLNNLRKYIENAGGQSAVMVPLTFITDMHKAVGEVVYGKEYSMATREELQEKLLAVVKNFGK